MGFPLHPRHRGRCWLDPGLARHAGQLLGRALPRQALQRPASRRRGGPRGRTGGRGSTPRPQFALMPSSVSAAAKAAVSPTASRAECTLEGDPRGDEGVRQAQLVRALPGRHEGRALGLGDHHHGLLATTVPPRRPRRRSCRRAARATCSPAAPPGRSHRRRSRRGQPVDRHVRSRVGGELAPASRRAASPARSPPAGHQVQLGRPDVAVRAAAEAGLPAVAERKWCETTCWRRTS